MTPTAERVAQVCDPVDRCPVCRSPRRLAAGRLQRNRYSEEIANLLSVDEDELLDAIRDVRCRECGLGYKDWWFKPDFYYKVFVEAAPTHPRGWDAVSDKFTPGRFIREVEQLRKAVGDADQPLINRQRRTVQSYIDNLPRGQRTEPRVVEILERYEEIDLERVSEADARFLIGEVAPLIRDPKPFGRFEGFNSDSLEALVRRHAPTLRSYGELGCPLWGLLPRLAGEGTDTLFLEDEHRAFWGRECCNENGRRCFDYAREDVGIDHLTSLTELLRGGRRMDMLGILNYLDHLADPVGLLQNAKQVADHLLIVLVPDEPDEPGVVQHHTSFDGAVVRRMAGDLEMELAEVMPCGEGPDPDFVAYVLS